MSDDWLWDGTGEPDPETARVHRALSSARYQGRLPELPRRRRWGPAMIAVAVGLAIAAAALVVVRGPAPSWACGDGCRLTVGEWLETGEESVDLEVADIGTMEVGPGSRLRLLATSDQQHRVELSVGRLHASVIAPPRLLVVDTPSARAVDLGCEYDLTVLEDGSSLLIVETGEVSLEHPERSAFVPSGAAAMTWPGHGPGIPWFTDAPVDYVEALQTMDREGRWERVPGVLSASGDTLSLWHLAQRVPDERRLAVLTRIEQLHPGSVGADRDGMRALDPAAIERVRVRLDQRW